LLAIAASVAPLDMAHQQTLLAGAAARHLARSSASTWITPSSSAVCRLASG
jgi:hypothetical protein